jgi:putative hydrolase of the HAD superfamily
MSKSIKHIFFDLDHTLWDFDKNSALTFERIFKLKDVAVHLDTFLEVYEPINLKYWKLYREEQISKPDLRYWRLREAFNKIGFFPEDELINDLSVSYIDHLTTINHLFDGATEVLDYLGNSYQLHIITNGFSEAQERKLKNAHIDGYFKTVTNSEMVGVKKPNPKIFNFALDAAKAQPEESVMIGDSLEADIEGAENVGMATILFDFNNTFANYERKKITNLIELKELF